MPNVPLDFILSVNLMIWNCFLKNDIRTRIAWLTGKHTYQITFRVNSVDNHIVPFGTRVYVVANTRSYRKVHKRKGMLFPRWSSKSHVKVPRTGSFRGYTTFATPSTGVEGVRLVGKVSRLKPYASSFFSFREQAGDGVSKEILSQVSQSYHKTMESRSGNLVSSAKSNSRAASASADKVTPLVVLFPFLLFISLLHHSSLYPVALSRWKAVSFFIFPLPILTSCPPLLFPFLLRHKIQLSYFLWRFHPNE